MGSWNVGCFADSTFNVFVRIKGCCLINMPISELGEKAKPKISLRGEKLEFGHDSIVASA